MVDCDWAAVELARGQALAACPTVRRQAVDCDSAEHFAAPGPIVELRWVAWPR